MFLKIIKIWFNHWKDHKNLLLGHKYELLIFINRILRLFWTKNGSRVLFSHCLSFLDRKMVRSFLSLKIIKIWFNHWNEHTKLLLGYKYELLIFINKVLTLLFKKLANEFSFLIAMVIWTQKMLGPFLFL